MVLVVELVVPVAELVVPVVELVEIPITIMITIMSAAARFSQMLAKIGGLWCASRHMSAKKQIEKRIRCANASTDSE